MKILFVATALDRPESHLIAALIAQGIEVRLLLGEAGKHGEILNSHKQQIELVSLKSRIDFRGIQKIRQTIKQFSPDIIHSLSGRGLSNALLASWGTRIKHVAYRGTMGNLSYWDPASWMSFLHPRLNRIICVSNAVRDDLVKLGIAQEKVLRIYKGHDPQWYRDQPPFDRSSLPIASEDKIIACVANSRPVKGIDILIQAFLLIPSSVNAQLLLIGEVRDSMLPALAKNDPRIHFVGYRKDASAIVATCDVFCMPSRRREGFPKALLEAMIQGVPAVVTNVGGLPEIVKNGETGIVVERDDIAMLSRALITLVNDSERCALFGARARSDIRERFSIDQTINQTISVYQELCTP